MKRQKWATKGGRVSQQGFRLMWAGLAMLIALLIAGIAHAPAAVIVLLIVLLFVISLTGLGFVIIGWRMNSRVLAEQYRNAGAGEEPARTPGEQL